jgi:DNA adenine methylase
MSAIAPIRPPAPYIGGKRMLAKRLVERINAVPHTLYAEPFVGMGGIFFRRDQRPKCEVINDWSDDVATFFRILQRHYVPFMDMLRWQITSRAGFDRLRRQDPSTLTDLERAARFLYLQRLAFGGKVARRNFGVDTTMGARFDVAKIGPLLEAAHERLTGVVIEHLPWSDFITRYDRPGTLFYLDPPYYGCEKDYGATLFDRPSSPPWPPSCAPSKAASSSPSTTTPKYAASSKASPSPRSPSATPSAAWPRARSPVK